LSYEEISGTGKHKILFSETQNKRLDRSLRLEKGLVLELNHEQLKINHSGGFLPLIFAGLGALGALIGGRAAVANTVIQAKYKQSEEDEIKRHNAEMENIATNKKSFYIGSGLKTKVNHSGGFLQFTLPLATILRSLITGTHKKRNVEELKT
jgi:hypothetical protein